MNKLAADIIVRPNKKIARDVGPENLEESEMKKRDLFWNKSLISIISIMILGLVLMVNIASAQITSATIVGTVSDPNGAPVPSASVTARNVDTGLTRTVTSGEDGGYRLEFLPVGNYVIEVAASSGYGPRGWEHRPAGHCYKCST